MPAKKLLTAEGKGDVNRKCGTLQPFVAVAEALARMRWARI